jgi:hypothetical protein
MKNIKTQTQPGTAFLLIAAGGMGRAALEKFGSLYEGAADQAPFHKFTLYADTEPGTVPAADAKLDLGLTADHVHALKANPAAFGPVAELMVQHYPHWLHPDDIKNGSRTLRLNTQLAMDFHAVRVAHRLSACLRLTARRAPGCSIVPILFSSTGGGAGSALVILLALRLADPAFRARITRGLNPNLLDTPLAVVTEPWALALQNGEVHADKILANALAFRAESALVEARQAFQYVFHQGLANEGGTVLDTPDQVSKALGTAVFNLCANWAYLKARWVDTTDSAKITDRYLGTDVPEHYLPKECHPPYAADVAQRFRFSPNGVNLQSERGLS